MRIGPYRIIKATTPDTYRLAMPPGLRLHQEFHTELLTPYQQDSSSTRANLPNEGLINKEGEPIYIVDRILDANPKRKTVKVRWKGYTEDYDTWEPISYLDSAIGLVVDYFSAHPQKRFKIPNHLLKKKTDSKRKRTTKRKTRRTQ